MKKTLPTLGGRSEFDYCGSISEGIRIWYGKGKSNTCYVSANDLSSLINEFNGRTVLVGNGRRNRPPDSIGAWLKEYVTSALIAAYIAKLLIEEGYAAKKDGPVIEVFP